MAEEGAEQGNQGNVISSLPLGQASADSEPAIAMISQYIKDLSVENPNAPDSYQWPDAPDIHVDFNIAARTVSAELHELELKVTATARTAQGTAFIVELAYGALIGMRNIPDEQAHPFLFAEAPRLVFPFARRIVADAVRDAGYAPLMIDPIDFGGLYVAQLQQQAQAAAEAATANPQGNA